MQEAQSPGFSRSGTTPLEKAGVSASEAIIPGISLAKDQPRLSTKDDFIEQKELKFTFKPIYPQ